VAFLNARSIGDSTDEQANGLFRGFTASLPESVVEMLSPQVAIERIERVIVPGDLLGDDALPGSDHGIRDGWSCGKRAT
jgi:hypothetical protein